ncbi:hypothetical protein Tco_0718486 [Tanacetum coccineum]
MPPQDGGSCWVVEANSTRRLLTKLCWDSIGERHKVSSVRGSAPTEPSRAVTIMGLGSARLSMTEDGRVKIKCFDAWDFGF